MDHLSIQIDLVIGYPEPAISKTSVSQETPLRREDYGLIFFAKKSR